MVTAIVFQVCVCCAYLLWLVRQVKHRRAAEPLPGTLRQYAIGFFGPLVVFAGALYLPKTVVTPSPIGEIRPKVAYYQEHASDFNLIFLGDSRTYCAFHPERLDPLLGTRSMNLAYWGHWFPVQLAATRDTLEAAPAGTTVVWSIGQQNFFPVHESAGKGYPIGAAQVPSYRRMGFRWAFLKENIFYFNPFTQLIVFPASLRTRLDDKMQEPAWRHRVDPLAGVIPEPSPAMEAQKQRRLQSLMTQLGEIPSVRTTRTRYEGTRLTSLVVLYAGGGYERIELDHAFFREKQRLHHAELLAQKGDQLPGVEPDPAYWNVFIATLDLFAQRGVKLIVNEMEEASNNYVSPSHREASRRFMQEHVRPTVERYGFAYTRVAWEVFTDEDYFDYNHLNRRGIEKFTLRVAEALRQHLETPPTTHAVQLR
jgi:hypothetical protein